MGYLSFRKSISETVCFYRLTKPYCSLIKKARKITAVHYRANGYVAVCIEPDGGCAMMLFSEKWSDHHHAAMQARLLAGHDIPTGVRFPWAAASSRPLAHFLFCERGIFLKEQNLIRYSIQLAFLKQLLERKLITDREYSLIKQRLMKDYRVVSELSS